MNRRQASAPQPWDRLESIEVAINGAVVAVYPANPRMALRALFSDGPKLPDEVSELPIGRKTFGRADDDVPA